MFSLLSEMRRLDGAVFVRGSVAYYSQTLWIQNMTIRKNILFGCEFDMVKYNEVLDACALLPDLKQFSSGESTEIGCQLVQRTEGSSEFGSCVLLGC